MIAAVLDKKPVPRWRRVLLKTHSWLGVVLCLPLVVIGLSGSVLVFKENIENSIISNKYKIIQWGDVWHSAGEIINAARSAAPEGYWVVDYEPGDELVPATVRFMPAWRADFRAADYTIRILVNPDTLEIVDRDFIPSFTNKLYLLHRELFMGEAGRVVVGVLGFALLVLTISGMVLWWPKKGQRLAALSFSRNVRDIHNAVGMWSSLVMLLVSVSGIYLAFPQSSTAGVTTFFTSRDLDAGVSVVPYIDAEPFDVDKAIEMVEKEVPDGKIIKLRLPQTPDEAYRADLSFDGYKKGAPPISVFVDQYASEIAETRYPGNYSPGEKITVWQHALHSGQGGGLIWRALVFVAGWLPLVFMVTGLLAWRRRIVSSLRGEAAATSRGHSPHGIATSALPPRNDR